MAKQFKGTKEKWRVFTNVHRECDGVEWGWVGLDTFNSKSINKCSIHWSGDEAKANALLISKAPELMKFAMFIASHEKGSAPSVGYFEEIIKKAETILDEILE